MKTSKVHKGIRGAVILMLWCVATSVPAKSFMQYGVGLGWRTDDVSWDVSGSLDDGPIENSVLKWKDVNLLELNGFFETYTSSNWYYQGEAALGWIIDGGLEALNNGTVTSDKGDDGSATDLTLAMGYRFGPGKGKRRGWFGIIPMVGGTWHRQTLELESRDDVISGEGVVVGLDNNFKTTWMGLWYGLRAEIEKVNNFKFYADYRHVEGNYESDIEWYEGVDGVTSTSYNHDTDASGDEYALGIRFRPSRGYLFDIAGRYREWKAEGGISRTLTTTDGVLQTHLNEVKWEEWSILLRSTWWF